jgi:hypothetical protein
VRFGLAVAQVFVRIPCFYGFLCWIPVIGPVVYTITAMPINLFFLSSSSTAWYALDTAVSILFGIDIIVCFFSAYVDDNGVLIKSWCDALHSFSIVSDLWSQFRACCVAFPAYQVVHH